MISQPVKSCTYMDCRIAPLNEIGVKCGGRMQCGGNEVLSNKKAKEEYAHTLTMYVLVYVYMSCI